MSQNIEMVFSGDATKLEQAWAKLGKQLDSTLAKVEKLNQSSAKGADDAAAKTAKLTQAHETFGVKAFGTLEKYTSAWSSLPAIIGSVTEALEKQSRVAEKAFQKVQSLAYVDSRVEGSAENAKDAGMLQEKIRLLAKKHGVNDFKRIGDALNTAQTTSGSDAAMSLKAVDAALGLTGLTPEETEPTAQAMVSMMQDGLTEGEAKGHMASSGAYLPFNQADLAKRVLTTAKASKVFYGENVSAQERYREHGALSAAFMRLTQSAEMTSTATQYAEADLAETFAKDDELKKIDPGTPSGRLAILRQRGKGKLDELARELEQKNILDIHGKAISRAGFMAILQGQEDERMERDRKLLGFDSAEYDKREQKLKSGTFAIASDFNKRKSDTSRDLAMADLVSPTLLQKESEARTNFYDLYSQMDSYGAWAREKVTGATVGFDKFRGVKAIDIANTTASDLSGQLTQIKNLRFTETSEEEDRLLRAMEQQVELLREQVEIGRKQLEALDEGARRNNMLAAAADAMRGL